MTTWTLYIIRRADGALYTGITTDVERRLAEHGAGRGAKALRGKGPLTLVLQREAGDRGTALRVEARIKRMTKAAKERLLGDTGLLDGLFESFSERDGS